MYSMNQLKLRPQNVGTFSFPFLIRPEIPELIQIYLDVGTYEKIAYSVLRGLPFGRFYQFIKC